MSARPHKDATNLILHGYIHEEDPPIDEGLVLAPDGETLVSPELAAELTETEDELMVEARKLDDEDDEDEDPTKSPAFLCLQSCTYRHTPAGGQPCLSCNVSSLSHYRAEPTGKAEDTSTIGPDSNYTPEANEPDDL